VSAAPLPLERLHPRDAELLARRARELAAPAAAGDAGATRQLVAFRLGAMACAVEASAVVRAIARLERVVLVPTGGGDRAAAFVDEEPLALADLAEVASGSARDPAELSGSPGLVVRTAAGLLAVAVDGPLDLLEERTTHLGEVHAGDASSPQVAARLASGASLLSSSWLVAWAERVLRST
jgi:hypothetical protein